MKTYLLKTKYNTFKYERRIPKALLDYLEGKSFRVSLGTDNTEAIGIALEYNKKIEEALQYIKLGLPSDMILSTLDGLISKEKIQKKIEREQSKGLFSSTVDRYLETKRGQILTKELKEKKKFYSEVCPPIFKYIMGSSNPKLEDINYNDLLQFRTIITKMPKRNIQKYKSMEVGSILKILDDVPKEFRVSTRTVNRALKWVTSIFSFSLILGELKGVNLAQSIPLLKTEDERLERLPLSDKEFNILHTYLPKEKAYLLSVLKYTGMRLSELYKCKIEEIDGVLCFSLLDRNIKLKTKSSYRIIPIHTNLLEGLDNLDTYRNKISHHVLSQTVSRVIKRLEFSDANKKTLYSLRHSFATKLITLGADSNIISELLGHAHTSMTLSRYASGYSVSQLKETIELL